MAPIHRTFAAVSPHAIAGGIGIVNPLAWQYGANVPQPQSDTTRGGQ